MTWCGTTSSPSISAGPLSLPAAPRGAAGIRPEIFGLLCCLALVSCSPRPWSGPPVDDGTGGLGGGPAPGPAPPAATVAHVRVNEVMTSNTETLADASGTFSAWLELYNAAEAPVDLSGVPLSDDPLAPAKWFFPAGPASVVPAGGYLVVFCDGAESREAELHTSFTLRNGPLELVLNDGSDLFFAEASALGRDRSLGRVPDGGESIAELETPTPGAANSGPLTLGESLRGDVDRDGAVNVTDAIDLLDALFLLEFMLHCDPTAVRGRAVPKSSVTSPGSRPTTTTRRASVHIGSTTRS